MRKIIFLFVLASLLFSCFDEEAAPDFLNGTIWFSETRGPVLDDDKSLLYSYWDTHTLIFNKNTFIHTYNRKVTEGQNASYKDEESQKMEGTYVIKYPKVIMTGEKVERVGALSANMLVVDWNGNNSILFFSKKKTN
jgi:hypothetical protein